MASPSPSPSVSQTRPYHFLCKSLLLALFLLALPLFPSQAPDFVRESILTKFWELLHLLFVGIAVSYGLFSRRNPDVGNAFDSRSDTVVDDDFYSMSHVSSFFGCGSESFTSASVDENFVKVGLNLNACGTSFASVDKELEDSRGLDEFNNRVQAWNSRYFKGESLVVLAQPNYGVDRFVGHKPLGLPVRSLRSGLSDTQTVEFGNKSESNFSVDESPKSSDEEFSSLGSGKLKEKVEGSDGSSSPVPWHPRSERMGMGENAGGVDPLHLRPLSVDESQFEYIKSGSFRSTASSSSKSSLMSQPYTRLSPSHSVSSESSSSKGEELGSERLLQSSSASPSPPTRRPVNDNTSRRFSHSRHYSYGTLLEDDVRRSFEDDSEGIYMGRRKDVLSRGYRGSRSLKLAAEELRKENSFGRSHTPDPVPPQVDGEESPNRWHSQHYTFAEDVEKSSEDDPKNLRRNRRNDPVRRRYRGKSALKEGAEIYEKGESSHGSSPTNSLSPRVSVIASVRALHSRPRSHGFLLEKDRPINMDDDSADLSKRGRKDSLGSKELKSSSLKCKSDPDAAAKVLSRGKSVRTIRSSRYIEEANEDGESRHKQIDDITVEMSSVEAGEEYMGKGEFRRRGCEKLLNNTSIESSHHRYSKLKPRCSENQNGSGREKQFAGGYTIDDEVDSDKEIEQPQVSIGQKCLPDGLSDAGNDHDEVDRKAGEFIAKFREQIRLQKMYSGEIPTGLHNLGGEYFR